MTKPFDLVDLEERLKSKGLVAVEGLAKIATTEVFGWLEESLMAEPNSLFKIGVPVLEALKPLVLAAEDKIDGSVGNP